MRPRKDGGQIQKGENNSMIKESYDAVKKALLEFYSSNDISKVSPENRAILDIYCTLVHEQHRHRFCIDDDHTWRPSFAED